MKTVIEAYVAAFQKGYPQKQVAVKFARKYQGVEHYDVLVDGEKGPQTLTISDMRDATRQFLQGSVA